MEPTMSDHASPPPVRHVALIGNVPPRRCGIATFTADLHAALRVAEPEAKLSTIAMTDPGMAYDYPEGVGYEIAQERIEDYLAAAAHLNALNPDVISVQHERSEERRVGKGGVSTGRSRWSPSH